MSTKTAARPIRRKRPTPGQVLEQAVEIGKVVSALRPFGVKQRMIAQATGAAERSVRNWKRTSVIGPTYEKRLRDLQQMSNEEVAAALGLSLPATKSRLLRARLQLREKLAPYFRRSLIGSARGWWGRLAGIGKRGR